VNPTATIVTTAPLALAVTGNSGVLKALAKLAATEKGFERFVQLAVAVNGLMLDPPTVTVS
jgi:hypothetical protein